MAKFKQTEWVMNTRYDMKHSRHYMNDELMVLHCHHFTSLYTQLALDADDITGSTRHLQETAKEVFYGLLTDYFAKQQDLSFTEKVNLAEQLYVVAGLGKLEIACIGDNSGEVVLHSSHIDAGWLKKWGNYNVPVNYVTAGFIAAVFAAVLNKDINTYNVLEVESIVCGAEKSKFIVARA